MSKPPPDAIGDLERQSSDIDNAEDLQAALAQRRFLIEQLESAGDSARLLLARNHLKLAVGLRQAGDVEGAISELHETIGRFGDLTLPSGRTVAAEGLWMIGLYTLQSGRYEETVAAVDALTRKYGTNESLQGRVVSALINKARAQGGLGRPDEQVKTLRDLVAQFALSPAPEVRQLVALAMFQLGTVLASLGADEQAMIVWGDLFERFRHDPPRDAPRLPFRAQTAKLQLLIDRALVEEAVVCANDLMEALSEADEPSTMAEIGHALIRSGQALERVGELGKALELFDCAADRLLRASTNELNLIGVYAQINVGVIRGRLGDRDGATAAMEALLDLGEPALPALDAMIRDASEPRPEIQREREPWALLLKGLILENLGQLAEADGIFAQLTERFAADESPIVKELVGAACDARARTNRDDLS